MLYKTVENKTQGKRLFRSGRFKRTAMHFTACKDVSGVATKGASKALESKDLSRVATKGVSKALESKDVSRVATKGVSKALESKDVSGVATKGALETQHSQEVLQGEPGTFAPGGRHHSLSFESGWRDWRGLCQLCRGKTWGYPHRLTLVPAVSWNESFHASDRWEWKQGHGKPYQVWIQKMVSKDKCIKGAMGTFDHKKARLSLWKFLGIKYGIGNLSWKSKFLVRQTISPNFPWLIRWAPPVPLFRASCWLREAAFSAKNPAYTRSFAATIWRASASKQLLTSASSSTPVSRRSSRHRWWTVDHGCGCCCCCCCCWCCCCCCGGWIYYL